MQSNLNSLKAYLADAHNPCLSHRDIFKETTTKHMDFCEGFKIEIDTSLEKYFNLFMK